MNIYKFVIAIILPIALPFSLKAIEVNSPGAKESKKSMWEYSLKSGFNIGGTAPVPLPAEIRSIDSYKPVLGFTMEANVTRWINDTWGLQTGLRLENKGMNTKATVKDYSMEIIEDDHGRLKGRWYGGVQTKVSNSFLTVPLLAVYKINSSWKLNGGLFFSYQIDGDFSGTVYDGYLRQDNPLGEKVNVPKATYDFSDDMRKFQWGAQIGGEWNIYNSFSINSHLTWGFKNIFQKDFKTITFSMYPIYLNIGFGYTFKR